MTKLATLFVLVLFFSALPTQAGGEDRYWNFGPMVHYEFGPKGQGGLTFGVETSYWGETPDNLPIGWDMGVEFAKTGIRIYTEAQTGLLVGVSVGPYLEFPYAGTHSGDDFKTGPRLGIQGSAWAWWVVAVDLRARWDGTSGAVSPGVFAKYPECLTDCEM